MNEAYEPIIRRVTSIGCDLTTDEATALLDDLVHAIAEQQRAWARAHQDALAGNAWDKVQDVITLIDPKTP
jgi:polyhydroxyalkanoate synthesis regulator phasin